MDISVYAIYVKRCVMMRGNSGGKQGDIPLFVKAFSLLISLQNSNAHFHNFVNMQISYYCYMYHCLFSMYCINGIALWCECSKR